jgi:hypothetical protein
VEPGLGHWDCRQGDVGYEMALLRATEFIHQESYNMLATLLISTTHCRDSREESVLIMCENQILSKEGVKIINTLLQL